MISSLPRISYLRLSFSFESFKTYITAALEYDEWDTSFADVLLIFVIGMIEYYVFSSLTVPQFNVVQFHERTSIISVLAALGYIRAFRSLRESRFVTYRGYRRERRLQAINVAGAVLVQALSTIVLLASPLPNAAYVTIGVSAAAVLAFNMSYSMSVTFASGVDTVEPLPAHSDALPPELPHITADFPVRPASRADAAAIAHLMTEHFDYIYSAVFDTSARMTQKILYTMLCFAGGRIPNFGFRSFRVASDGEAGKVVALLKTSDSGDQDRTTAYTLVIPAIIAYHLGCVGLIRAWRNWRVLQDTVPDIAKDELYIQYIAVSSKFQKCGIGSRLIQYAIDLARNEGRPSVVLEVRERNHTARKFFARHGFKDRQIVKRHSDQLLGKGPTLKMERSIEK